MLSVSFIRENSDKIKSGIEKKGTDPKLVDKFLRFDEAWREKTHKLDQLKAEQNAVTKELAGGKNEELLSRAQLLKKQVEKINQEEDSFKNKRDTILYKIPNIPFDDVPVGPDESGNKVIKTVFDKTVFDFNPKHYLDIAESLNLINVKRASGVSGTRFGYLLNEAALIEFSLVKLAFDTLVPEGFTPIVPPVMIRPDVFAGMGRLAPGEEKERYYLPEDDLYLVGSAEHTIGPFHMNDVINEEDLPVRYVGFSTCFRREAGSYGKDTKGILRVHQFDKVEMFSFSHPEKSEEEHKFLLRMQEKLMKALEIPYRVVEVCTGDMGWTDARQYDIETWFPFEGKYRETHSASNTTDFQARGINVKFSAKKNKKPEFVHMLNATAIAVGRTIISIIENYQTKNGKIKIPKALQGYVGKEEIGG